MDSVLSEPALAALGEPARESGRPRLMPLSPHANHPSLIPLGLAGQLLPVVEMAAHTARASVVGPRRALDGGVRTASPKAPYLLREVVRAEIDVVAGVEQSPVVVSGEAAPGSELGCSGRHELHETHRSGRALGVGITSRLHEHDDGEQVGVHPVLARRGLDERPEVADTRWKPRHGDAVLDPDGCEWR